MIFVPPETSYIRRFVKLIAYLVTLINGLKLKPYFYYALNTAYSFLKYLMNQTFLNQRSLRPTTIAIIITNCQDLNVIGSNPPIKNMNIVICKCFY